MRDIGISILYIYYVTAEIFINPLFSAYFPKRIISQNIKGIEYLKGWTRRGDTLQKNPNYLKIWFGLWLGKCHIIRVPNIIRVVY